MRGTRVGIGDHLVEAVHDRAMAMLSARQVELEQVAREQLGEPLPLFGRKVRAEHIDDLLVRRVQWQPRHDEQARRRDTAHGLGEARQQQRRHSDADQGKERRDGSASASDRHNVAEADREREHGRKVQRIEKGAVLNRVEDAGKDELHCHAADERQRQLGEEHVVHDRSNAMRQRQMRIVAVEAIVHKHDSRSDQLGDPAKPCGTRDRFH